MLWLIVKTTSVSRTKGYEAQVLERLWFAGRTNQSAVTCVMSVPGYDEISL